MSTAHSQRQPTKAVSLSHEERRNQRKCMASYVAEQVNAGVVLVEAKQRAAKFFRVSMQQIRIACREFMTTKAKVKPSKSRRTK